MSETTLPTMEDLYPNNDAEGHWHQAHEPYIGAVVYALDAAKLTTGDWFADANDPRDGAIELNVDMLQTQADEVHLCWQEERGWWLIKEYERDRGENQKIVVELDCSTIADPASVLTSVREHFGIPPTLTAPDDHPDVDFPGHQFDDGDVAFELALRRYRAVEAS